MSEYFNVTTNNGDAVITAAIANSTKLNITHVAFGDGNGAVPTPSKDRTTLVKEVYRQVVSKYTIHPSVTNWLIVEAIIPSDVGGFWIREIGLIADGVLISHGSHAPFFKVAETNGVSEFRLKYTINIQDGGVVDLALDESLIYATQAWVDDNYVPRNEIVNDLVTDDSEKPLSAAQGRILNDQKLNKDENAVGIKPIDNRILKPSEISLGVQAYFATLNSDNSTFYCDFLSLNGWHEASGGLKNALVLSKTGQSLHHYQAEYASQTWTIKKQIAYTDSNITGNAASASKLQSSRTISFTGAATGSFSFDGSTNPSCVLTLANSGVAANTYASTIQIPSITVNAKGLITSISQQTIRSATTAQTGVVQLVDDLTTNDASKALTAAQGKKLQDSKLDATSNAVGTVMKDDRTLLPTELSANSFQAWFGTYNSDTTSAFCDLITLNGWNDGSGGRKNALVFNKAAEGLYHFQSGYDDTSWTVKKQIAYTDSNITGNSASASKLQTPRRINNVQFDGTSDITIFDSTKFKADGATSSVNDVAWNAISGVYSKISAADSRTVVHFLGSGSAPALQLLTAYKNGGLWYRSARDFAGFEEPFERIITEKGGSIQGDLSITGNISSNGFVLLNGPEAQFRHQSGNYLFINGGGWGVYSNNGMVPLSVVSGGTGNSDGRAPSAERLAYSRNISISGAVSGNANFDGSGNINISTSLQAGIGVNQSFNDLTASRVSGVVYTNNTGKPIFLIVTAAGSNNTALVHTVDGYQLINTNESAMRTLSYPVPNGFSYMITAATINKWIEIR